MMAVIAGCDLMDMNLSKKDGCDLLADIKSDVGLRSIPVVVLATSSAEEEILKAYGLNTNYYVTNPVDLEDFLNAV